MLSNFYLLYFFDDFFIFRNNYCLILLKLTIIFWRIFVQVYLLVDKASYVLFIHPPTLSIMEHSPKKENNIACFSNLNFMMASPKFQGDPSFVNWNFVEGMVTSGQVRFVHLWLTHLITITNTGGQTINCHVNFNF